MKVEKDLETMVEMGLNLKKLKKAIREKRLTQKEVDLLAKNLRKKDPSVKTYKHYFSKKKITFGVISDTHLGIKGFKEHHLLGGFKLMESRNVSAIYHVGDILEGMSGRDGHIYELTHTGAESQLDYATEIFSKTKKDIYAITGNHDSWFMKKGNMGLDVGTVLEQKLDNFYYLGNQEADVKLAPNVTMKLFHPNDGSAYALSYKGQKLVESFTGGEKPNIVLQGHYHKALYMFNRNVHHIDAGTLCGQSEWMRGKKISAHIGFWIVDVYIGKKGVERITPEFIPFYEE